MIAGRVDGLQPRVNVAFRVAGQPDLLVECVVDTGFEGALTLPAAAVASLGLPYLAEISANLADDTDIRADVYVATIGWNGADHDVALLALGGRPLLGTALLDGHHLAVDFIDGGAVRIASVESASPRGEPA